MTASREPRRGGRTARATPRKRGKRSIRSTPTKAAPRDARAIPLPPAPGEPPQRPTLEQVLDNLGSAVAQVIVAPRGLAVPVGEPLIYDPAERTPVEPEAIVLAVGTRAEGFEAEQLVLEAGAAGACAVGFKLHDRQCGVGREAEQAGVALLAVPDEVSWTHLNELLTRAVRSATPTTAGAGLASVPTGDLFALANAVAGMVGGAVTIEDPRGRVLAYSNLEWQPIDEARRETILGRRPPDMPGSRATYRKLWATEGVVRIERIEGLQIMPRLAVAVRAGGEILGSIWAIAPDKPGTKAERALTEAARIAALHLIQARGAREIQRRVQGELLRSLLEGRGSPESAAARLGIEVDAPLAILGFELYASGRAQEELHRERLVDLVALYCEAFRRRAACVAIGRIVYALLPLAKPTGQERLADIAQEILEHAEGTLRTPIRAAVGSAITSVHDVPRSTREVDRVLRVLGTDAKGRKLASIDDVSNQAILLELRDLAAQHPQLTRGRLRDVFEHDREHDTSYIKTLRAYLDAFGDVPTAAARITVHPNTFRYRLRRVVEVFGLDLDDPDERLVTGLQLRLMSTPGGDETV